jgi:hypothetical protein
LSLPTLAKLGTTGEVPQTLAHAYVELSRMHVSAGRAHSTAMRAKLGCMDRDDDAHGKRTVECDWRKRGLGLGETNHI